MGRSHPARQARVVVGVAGSAGFLVMVGTISEASTQILAADLSASLEIPETSQGLDLQGTAVPVPATAADAAEATTETGPAPTAQPPATEGETTTTLAEAPEAGSVDAPATTAPPATTTTTTPTTTTTAPPQTDTTSSGS